MWAHWGTSAHKVSGTGRQFLGQGWPSVAPQTLSSMLQWGWNIVLYMSIMEYLRSPPSGTAVKALNFIFLECGRKEREKLNLVKNKTNGLGGNSMSFYDQSTPGNVAWPPPASDTTPWVQARWSAVLGSQYHNASQLETETEKGNEDYWKSGPIKGIGRITHTILHCMCSVRAETAKSNLIKQIMH